jgi:hypothetical protein
MFPMMASWFSRAFKQESRPGCRAGRRRDPPRSRADRPCPGRAGRCDCPAPLAGRPPRYPRRGARPPPQCNGRSRRRCMRGRSCYWAWQAGPFREISHEVMSRSSSRRWRSPVRITSPRAAQLYRLVHVLAEAPRNRMAVLTRGAADRCLLGPGASSSAARADQGTARPRWPKR